MSKAIALILWWTALLATTVWSTKIQTSSPPPINCAAVLCARPDCENPIPPPPGQCCPRCPSTTLPPKCATIQCVQVVCEGAFIPPGECCPRCPPKCPHDCEQFFDGCNNCKCDRRTGLTGCTRRYCEPDDYEPFECFDEVKCPRNMKFLECGTCNSTCLNPLPVCTRECKPRGCHCLPPYALDFGGRCLNATDCQDSSVVLCGPIDDCPLEDQYYPPGQCCPICRKCDDPNAKFFEAGPCVSPCGEGPCVHIQPGPPGCYCKDPQNMRLLDGKCVLVENCPGECAKKRNAEHLEDGLADYRRCFNPYPNRLNGTDDTPNPGCFCKEGFVRHSSGRCIPKSMCPKLCPKGCARFFDGCNECECEEEGKGACTEIACLEWKHPRCLDCEDELASYTEFGPCVGTCATGTCVHVRPGDPGCYCKDPENMRLEDGKCIYARDCPDKCDDVVCPTLWCPKKDQVKLSETDCCPVCKGCEAVDCAGPSSCPYGVPYVPEGECCPVCPQDCRLVRCASCESQNCELGCYKPPNACCETCLPDKCVEPPDCPALRCASRLCPDGKTSWGCTGKCYWTPNGECSGFTPESVCYEGNGKCRDNEHFEDCGTACPKTCENKDEPIFCTKQCVSGCFCNEGYVRNDKKKCVPESECCADKQSYRWCSSMKRRGYCDRHSVQRMCKETCGLCDSE